MIKKRFKKLVLPIIVLIGTLTLFGCINNSSAKNGFNSTTNPTNEVIKATENKAIIAEDGSYTSKDEVALYIYTYKRLPKNFITKKEAKKLGWVPSKNNLGKVAKGKSIGGDIFSNFEKVLPVVDGRKYYECDIDYAGKKRNAKRIVYADDFNEDIGFIYYTEDHYKTFERLY